MAVFISIQSITEVSRPGAFHLKIKYLNPPPVCFCLSGGRWKRHFPDIILVLFKANTDAVQIMGVICIRSIFPVVAAAAFISFHHGNEEGAAQVRILVGFQEGLKLPGAGTGVWPAACICKEGKGVDFIQCIFQVFHAAEDACMLPHKLSDPSAYKDSRRLGKGRWYRGECAGSCQYRMDGRLHRLLSSACRPGSA